MTINSIAQHLPEREQGPTQTTAPLDDLHDVREGARQRDVIWDAESIDPPSALFKTPTPLGRKNTDGEITPLPSQQPARPATPQTSLPSTASPSQPITFRTPPRTHRKSSRPPLSPAKLTPPRPIQPTISPLPSHEETDSIDTYQLAQRTTHSVRTAGIDAVSLIEGASLVFLIG